jgi:hypothetical protein
MCLFNSNDFRYFLVMHYTPHIDLAFSSIKIIVFKSNSEIIFLIIGLHFIFSLQKYYVYKYILICLLFVYTPIAFYFYIKWLVLDAVKLRKFLEMNLL